VKNKTSAKKKTTKPTSKPDVRNVFVDSLAKTIVETFLEMGELVELRDSEILVFGKQEFFLSCAISARVIADVVIAEIEHKKEPK
jgi:hypothetical protein